MLTLQVLSAQSSNFYIYIYICIFFINLYTYTLVTVACGFVGQVIMLGDSGVGKTSLLIRFRDGRYVPSYFLSTVGIDFRVSVFSLSLSLSLSIAVSLVINIIAVVVVVTNCYMSVYLCVFVFSSLPPLCLCYLLACQQLSRL